MRWLEVDNDMIMASKLRLRLPTIVNYTASILRLVFSMAFSLIVARNLDVDKFGIYAMAISLGTMLASAWTFIDFWLRREIARGKIESLGSGSLAAILMSVGLSIIAFALGWIGSAFLGWSLEPFYYSSILVLLLVFMRFAESILSSTKPEFIGYKAFLLDILRIIIVVIFFYVLNIEKTPVIPLISYIMAIGIVNIWLFFVLKNNGLLQRPRNLNIVVNWLMLFKIPLPNSIRSFIVDGSRYFIGLATKNEAAAAYLHIIFIPYTTIVRSARLSFQALYARLLSKKSMNDMNEVLKIYLFLSGGILTIFIGMPKTIISIFNPAYIDAWLALVIMTITSFVTGIADVYYTTVLGSTDEHLDKGMKDLARFNYLRLVLTSTPVMIGTIVLGFFMHWGIGTAMILYASVMLFFSVMYLITFAHKIRRLNMPLYPRQELVSMIVASLIGMLLLWLTNANTAYTSKRLMFIFLDVAPQALLTLLVYALIWLILSPWARELVMVGFKRVVKKQ